MKRRLRQLITLLLTFPVLGFAQSLGRPMSNLSSFLQTETIDGSILNIIAVQPSHEGFHIQWEVDADVSARYYYIERSDNEESYHLSGGIQASPGRQVYDFIDVLPLSQGTQVIDYRVQVFYENGEKAYSMSFRVFPDARPQLQLRPMPVLDHLILEVPQSPCIDCRATILDATGKPTLQRELPEYGPVKLDLTPLDPGVYFLHIQGDHRSWISRVICK